MNYKIETIVVGDMEANCYILTVSESSRALIVDPGAEPKKIKEYLIGRNLKPAWIVNTHAHIDHIGANNEFEAPILIHRLDASSLKEPGNNLSALVSMPVTSRPASRLLEDGDQIELSGLTLRVLHTPGHTPGSICLAGADFILTGDTLFRGGVGRTDFPGGSERLLLDSIKKGLLIFPDSAVIYPGHGPPSTIGEERRTNPFLASLQ